jgi:ferritin
MKLKTEAKDSTEKLDIKRRQRPLSEDIQKLLLRQLKHELYNHNLYMSFSNFYGVQGLAILEEYYKQRADEEYLHHSWIRKYMNENDVAYIYPDIPAISETFEDNVTPFKLTVDKEIETTQLIYEMVDAAWEEGDWATFNWLNGNDPVNGRLVQEQVEEESISRTALDIAMEEGSWLRKEKSIMNAYKGDVD